MPVSRSKKKKRKRKKLFDRFKAKLDQEGLLKGKKIITNPPGEEKMSDVLMEFIEPYAEFATTDEEFGKLIPLASPLLADRRVASDLKAIYTAPTREEGERQLEEFAAKWDWRYPTISKQWRGNWERLAVFFSYPPEIRKVIYTTNAIESANSGLRRVIKNRGSLPTDEAALKLIYLALQNLSQKWTMPVKDWRAALNQFAILFEGRLPL